tara:strand:- start:306 stop:458 length:153 start_codon:yes stop_codon:yes gene_type:complete
MKGMEGNADTNNDNKITSLELNDYISKNVSKIANQDPQLEGDINKVLVKW